MGERLITNILLFVSFWISHHSSEILQNNLVGVIGKDIENIDKRILKIDEFVYVVSTGVTTDQHTIVIEKHGLYLVSCQILIQTNSKQLITLEINIDDEKHSAFQASTSNSERFAISVNGIFKTAFAAKIQVLLKTENKISVLRGSRISLTQLRRTEHLQAFSVHMTRHASETKINLLKNASFPIWTQENSYAMFIDTNLFVPENGYLVTSCSCVYIVVASVIFLSQENKQCKHTVLLKKNENFVIALQNEQVSSWQSTTITFLRYIRFNKNDRVWLEVASTCNDKVQVRPESTFSMSQYTSNLEGFSLGLSEYLSARAGWFLPDLTLFKLINNGDFRDPDFKISSRHITPKTSGFLFVSISVEMTAPIGTFSNVMLAICKNIYLDGNDDIQSRSDTTNAFWSQSSPNGTTYISLQLNAKFSVKKNDLIRVYLKIPNNGKWLIMKTSTISIFETMTNYFNEGTVESPGKSQFQTSSERQLCPECFDYGNEYLKQLPDKRAQVLENGIYQIIVDFEIDKLEDNVDIELALIFHVGLMEPRKEHVVLFTKEKEVSHKKTFKLASSVRFHTETTFGIYLRTNKRQNIAANCRTQLHYLGDHYSTVGFQANLNTDFSIQGNTGYFTVNNFQNLHKDSVLKSLYYNTGAMFKSRDGTFKAPVKGIYLVSVNLAINGVIMTSAQNYAALTIKINKKASALFKLKQENMIRKVGTGVRNSTVSFCLTGALQFSSHDIVSMEVFINSDDHWSIDQRSSFSIVLLTRKQNGFTLYRPSNKVDGKTISGWEPSHNPPPFGMFTGSTKESPSIKEKKSIVFTKTGIYIISLNILLNHKGTEKQFRISLVKQTNNDDKVTILCDSLTVTYKVMSAACQTIHRFEKYDSYVLTVESSSQFGVSDFYDEQSNDQNMAYLSVVLLEEPFNYQAGLVELKGNFEFSMEKNTIKPWRANTILNTIGNNGFDPNKGSLRVRAKGWFLFSLNVQCERAFGNGTITLTRLGDSPGHSLIESKGKCNNDHRLLSLTGIEYLDDGETIYPELSGYGGGEVIASQSYFSFAYLNMESSTRYYVNSKTNYFSISNSKSFEQPISWSISREQTQPLVTSFTFNEAGIYLITANVVIATNSTNVELNVKLNDKVTLTSKESILRGKSGAERRTKTLVFAGAIVLHRGTADVTVNLKSASESVIEPASTSSVTFVNKNHKDHPVAVLRMEKRVKLHPWISFKKHHLEDFTIDALSRFHIENEHTIIPEYSGFYLLNCNIIILSKASVLTLGLWLNGELAAYVTEYVTLEKTLSISQTIYLKQGSKISLMTKEKSSVGYFVEKGSTWSIVLIESPQGIGENPMLPVITKDLIVGNIIQYQQEGDLELTCDVVPPSGYTYAWYFNNKVLREESSYTLHPNRYYDMGNGSYQCQAISDGVGPLSRSAVIKIIPINECHQRRDLCLGNDSLCMDKLVGYDCVCLHSRQKYVYGHGCVLQPKKGESSFPLFILILVVCLTILIVLVCSMIICLKRRIQQREDPERQAVVGAENPDDITMQSLNNSLAEDYSDQGTLDRRLNGSVTPTDDITLLVRNDTRNGGGRRDFSTRSYFPSRYDNTDEDIDNNEDHNWRRFINNTQV